MSETRQENVSRSSWRTRDILIAAAIGVSFSVVFLAWNIAWGFFEPLNAVFPVLRDVLYAVWLIPGVLAGLIIKKPGAALFAEVTASSLSAYLGSQWGVDAALSGIVQGAGAEIVFAATRYRNWSFPVLATAAALSALAAWVHDWLIYYAAVSVDLQLARAVLMVISAVVLAAAGSVWLRGTLMRAGVLERSHA
jgi:energy-coupling factor transport system permease protein